MENKSIIRKIAFVSAGLIIIVFAGIEFYQHRNHKETVVINDKVLVKKLGDYFD